MNRNEAFDLLQEIDEEGVRVSEWEANFIDALMEKYETDSTWSPSQAEQFKIAEIYDARVDDAPCAGDESY